MEQQVFINKHILQFSCIGSECEDNCCTAGWTIHVNKEQYNTYKKLEKEKQIHLLQHIKKNKESISKEDYAILKCQENGICPFLTEKKLCGVQIEYGFDMLNNTCKSYPRTIKKVNNVYYETAHLSCPEIARLILLTKIPFNWIKLEEKNLKESVIVPSGFLGDDIYIRNIQKIMMKHIEKRKYTLPQRIWLIGSFLNNFYEGLYKKIEIHQAMNLAKQQINKLANNQLRSVLEFKISFILNIILNLKDEINRLNLHPRLEKCLQLFLEGMNIQGNDNINTNGFLDLYEKNYNNYYRTFFSQHEYILENYCLYYFQHEIFPYDSRVLAEKFLKFNIELSILNLILVGMSASSVGLHEKNIIQLFQSYAKLSQHDKLFKKKYIDNAHDLLLKHTTNYLELISILIS